MTTLPPNADELVSAYLDGEAAPDEIELVESNDELLARVAAMRAVSRRLTSPITPSPELREIHLASALAAFDELMLGDQTDAVETAVPGTGTAGVPHAAPHVASLDAARQRRRPRRLNGLIAAAAAALLLFVGITALTVSRTNEGFDTAAEDAGQLKEAAELDTAEAETFSVEASTDDAAGATMAAPAEEEVAPADESTASMMAEAPAAEAAMADDGAADSEGAAPFEARAVAPTDPALFFGSFPSGDALRLFLVDGFSSDELRERATSNEAGLFPTCQASIDELAVTTGSTLIGTAEIEGVFVELHLVPDSATILVVEPFDCTVAAVLE